MSRSRRIMMSLLFVSAIVGLQSLLRFSSLHFPQLHSQTAIIKAQQIDPSALFYTESKLALKAEKQVRRQLQ